jgi:hypothetical protein
MLGHNIELHLCNPEQVISGELRKQMLEGVWVYWGWAEKAALHFYPQHRIVSIIDCGRTYR